MTLHLVFLGIGLGLIAMLLAQHEHVTQLRADLEACRKDLAWSAPPRQPALDVGDGASAEARTSRRVEGSQAAVTRPSDSGEYEVSLRARRAERRPSVGMPNVTIVTHVTADRAERLARMCRTWRGPMSVAVFAKPGEDPAAALETVAAADECLRRHADLHSVRALRQGAGADMYAHYPFNVQRNAALEGAVGEWVWLLDVDFDITPSEAGRERVFSSRLHALRQQHAAVLGADEDERLRAVLVVPAVETVTKAVTAPRTVVQLREALGRHEVCAFYGHYCKACHLPTQVERYAGGASPSMGPYRVEYEEGYEPYVVVSTKHLPRYDEKFIGRGWDKMSFFFELAAQERMFVVLPPPFPFLVHQGRGDLPKNYTPEYMDRQRENSMLMHNFKAEVAPKYNPNCSLARKQRAADEVDGTHRNQLIDWATVSSSLGDGRACVARWRGAALDNETTPRLEAALSYACSHIDCSPLLPGGLRHFPQRLSAHADWALDRYMAYALAKGETPDQACDFGGAAKLVACTKQCFGCIVRPTTTVPKINAAVEWVCGPDALENCKAVLTAVGGNATRGLEAKAAVLFTFNYLVNRCVHHDANVACYFGGAGMRVPCARVPD